MNTYQSTRVTFVPKPTKYRTQLKVEPVRSQPHCEDTALNPVLRWNSTSITVAGLNNAPGVNASQLYTPTDVALDPFNTLYIPDFINNRVQKWLIGASSGTTVTGQVNATLSNTTGYLNRPAGIYIDSNDNIFVSDSNNHRIQLWANGALVGTLIAGTGSAGTGNNEFYNPYSIVQDSSTKTLYIGNYNNHRMMSYTSGALLGSVVARGDGLGTNNTQLNNPVGLYFDSFTNSLLIANFMANNIV
ncbi:unnamed protein product [Rotaria sp. Silwood2]|nr:unnamed protein product [Rotaria sp. Silwood2]